MSLILDALNRSRGDTGQVPGLATQHYLDEVPRGPKRYQALLVLALLAALLVIGWLLWEKKSGPFVAATGSGQSVPAPPPRQPLPAEQSPASLAVARIEPARVEPARVEPDQAVPELVEPDLVEPDLVEPDRGSLGPDEPGPGVAELYRQQQPSTTAEPVPAPASQAAQTGTARKEEPVDIEQLLFQAKDELENARLDEHEAAFLADLSQHTKDSIPTIMYQRHDYSGKPSKSVVVLNGKTLAAGASAAGLKVEEILPDSVVLNYRGTRFRLRALNSWVNL